MASIKDVKILGVERPFLDRFREPTRRMAVVQAQGAVIGEAPRYAARGAGARRHAGADPLPAGQRLRHRSATSCRRSGIFAFAGLRLFPALQTIYRQLGQLRVSQAGGRRALRRHDGDPRAGAGQPAAAAPAPLRARRPARARRRALRLSAGRAARRSRASTSAIPARTHASASSAAPAPARPRSSTSSSACSGPTQGAHPGRRRRRSPATNLRAWQNNIGYVPQQIFLIDDTVAANIAFGMLARARSTWPRWSARRGSPSCTTSS